VIYDQTGTDLCLGRELHTEYPLNNESIRNHERDAAPPKDITALSLCKNLRTAKESSDYLGLDIAAIPFPIDS